MSTSQSAPRMRAVLSNPGAGRRGAAAAEALSLTFATLALGISAAALTLLAWGGDYEFLAAQQAYGVWLTAGWAVLASLGVAAVLWARRLWRLRRRSPAGAALLGLVLVVGVVAAGLLVWRQLVRAPDIRDLVDAEGRVGPYSFTYWPEDGTIGVAGGIGPGFAGDLKAAMARHPRFTRIVITSGGGLVSEALAAARLLEARHTTVVARWQCDSACTLILMAGDHRYASKDMAVGFHAVSPLIARDDPIHAAAVLRQRRGLEDYLTRRGVPPSVLAEAQRLGRDGLNAVPAPTLVSLGVLDGLVDEQLRPLRQ